jgi:hypothetical protein
MANLTNWHLEKLIEHYNSTFKRRVRWIDLTRLIKCISETDTKTEDDINWFLIETIIYSHGNLYIYIGRKNFESCILEHEPKMEMAG